MDLLKRANIDEARGVVGATPEGMGHHIFVRCKMTLNARINVLVYFMYIKYIEICSYFLRLQGGGL